MLFRCCIVGAEVRKVVRDGWPISQIIATDIEEGMLIFHPRSSRKNHLLLRNRILGFGTQIVQNHARDLPRKIFSRGRV